MGLLTYLNQLTLQCFSTDHSLQKKWQNILKNIFIFIYIQCVLGFPQKVIRCYSKRDLQLGS